MPIKEGDTVKVEYTGTFDDGTVFDSSESHGQPLVFEVGSNQVIEGFDRAVIGMEKGREKNVRIEAKDAYGEPDPSLISKVPASELPSDAELKPGMTLLATTPEGDNVPVRIGKIEGNSGTIGMICF